MGDWNWINSAQCFNRIHLKKTDANFSESYADYTWGYCTGNLLIMVSSMLSLAACILLLVVIVNSSGWKKMQTYKKTKTWIFILLVFFEFTVVLRYTFTLYDSPLYDPILVTA